MEWWQAVLLGLVQGLTEFLPVSSSGHLMIFKELLGVDAEGFLDFTVTVHFATVLATLVVFWSAIVQQVGIGLCITAGLLLFSDNAGKRFKVPVAKDQRNGVSYWQAFVVGIAQAFAVAPGVSRSGSTIATGLLTGVKRENMAQFSFLMVLIPIIGEQSLDLLKAVAGTESFGAGVAPLSLCLGFVAAFLSGLFACKVMIAVVKKAKLTWFALYCLVVAALIFIFA